MEYPEVYKYSLEEAHARGEEERFRQSHRLDIACKRAVEAAIRANFDGLCLNDGCMKTVVEEYGHERVGWVLANTVRRKEHDGRFSRRNREWAESIPVPESPAHGFDLRDEFVVESHPAVLDGFINLYRKGQENKQEQESKPTIKEQLAEPLQQGSGHAMLRNRGEAR